MITAFEWSPIRSCVESWPTDLGSPQRLVSGVVGSDDVELTQRAIDAYSVIGDIGSQRPVCPIDIVVGSCVGDDGKLDRGDREGSDSPARSDGLSARYVDGGLAS